MAAFASREESQTKSHEVEIRLLRQQLNTTTEERNALTKNLAQVEDTLKELTAEASHLRTISESLQIELERSESKRTDLAQRLGAAIEDAKASGDKRHEEVTARLHVVEDERQRVVQEMKEVKKEREEAQKKWEKDIASARAAAMKEGTASKETVSRLEAEVLALERFVLKIQVHPYHSS